MLGKKVILAAILGACLASPLCAQEPASYDEAVVLYGKALAAFAADDYDTAIRMFDVVDAFLGAHPMRSRNFDHVYRDFSLSDVVKERRALGEIKPIFTHRVLALYIKKTNADHKGETIKGVFSDELRRSAEVSQEICKKYFEVLSGGRMTLSFERVELDSALTRAYGDSFIQGDVDSIVPYPSDAVFSGLGKIDTYLFYYDDGGFKSAGGGVPTALGGTSKLWLLPGLLTAPKRGRIVVSSSLLHRPGTLLHELFHTMENFYNIKPAHGYLDENRAQFPQWLGKGEFDYYRYQFGALFPASSKPAFDLVAANPMAFPDAAYAVARNRYKSLTKTQAEDYGKLLERIRKADAKTDKSLGRLYDELFDIFSFDPEPLLAAGVYHHYYGDKKTSFLFVNRAYTLNPKSSEACYFMGVAYFHQERYVESVRYLGEGIALLEDRGLGQGAGRFYQYRATVYYKAGSYAEGNADLARLWRTYADYKDWAEKYLVDKARDPATGAAEVLAELRK